MVEPTDSQQVESEKTTEVLQRVESDATPRTLSISVSFEIPPTVTHDENHVIGEDYESRPGYGSGPKNYCH